MRVTTILALFCALAIPPQARAGECLNLENIKTLIEGAPQRLSYLHSITGPELRRKSRNYFRSAVVQFGTAQSAFLHEGVRVNQDSCDHVDFQGLARYRISNSSRTGLTLERDGNVPGIRGNLPGNWPSFIQVSMRRHGHHRELQVISRYPNFRTMHDCGDQGIFYESGSIQVSQVQRFGSQLPSEARVSSEVLAEMVPDFTRLNPDGSAPRSDYCARVEVRVRPRSGGSDAPAADGDSHGAGHAPASGSPRE